MYARALMSASAALMALLGVIGSFLPEETLNFLGSAPDTPTVILVQITAALYLAFAMLNWTARGSIIGGIYSRPVTLGNFLHTAVVSALLVKASIVLQAAGVVFLATVYTVFAIWFGLVLFTHPGGPNS